MAGTVLGTEVQACAGRGTDFPSDSLGVSWAIVLGPEPLSIVSHPYSSPRLCPSPRENQNRGEPPPPPCTGQEIEARGRWCAWLKVTQPSMAMPEMESDPISPSPTYVLMHFAVWDACDPGGC